MPLKIKPCHLRAAREYASQHHRHSIPPVGGKFAVACYDGDVLCGVAICGRPVSRYLMMGRPLKSCAAARMERTMLVLNCMEPVVVLVLIWAMSALSPIRWHRRAGHPCGPLALPLTVRPGAGSGQASGAGITMWLQRS